VPAGRHAEDPEVAGVLRERPTGYLNTAGHSALIQAALAHAQFETIHPFKDDNGRVGRALIHTVLVRRGLTSHAVLPISPVLLTRSNEYVAGLAAYRYEALETSMTAQAAQSQWLRCFLQAVAVAGEQAVQFATDLAELQERWGSDLASHRRREGIREVPRADSATARILATLQEHPVLTTPTVMRLFDLSQPPASAALEELTAAGVLTARKLGRAKAFLATDVFDLITFAERRPASTRWDTAAVPPSRPAPYADPAR
jgi:Fic family protein